MNNRLRQHLRKKGWSKQEIKKTEQIIKKSKKTVFLDKYVYWFALFIGLIGNLVISIALIPFLLAITGFLLYAVVVILGSAFGLFFEIVIRDIENLQKKHHIVAGVVIPFLALINMYVITIISYKIRVMFGLAAMTHMPILIGFLYAISFISPYLIYQLILKK